MVTNDSTTVGNLPELFPVGTWRFDGRIGAVVDKVARGRFTTRDAWDSLYPQTEEAFRGRVDDTSHAPRGVWRGEFWGKYILGAIEACRYYGDEGLKERIRDAVRGLLATQDPDGYIGTYADSTFYGTHTWNIWVRKYTLWGLLEAWRLLGDDSILQAAIRLTDHLISQVGPEGDAIIQTGQMNGLPSTSILTPVVDLYRATGEERFLGFARHIADQWSRHPDGPPDLYRKGLTGEPIHTWFDSPQEWAKSYEFISCVEGMLELYRTTKEPSYLVSAQQIHRLIRAWEENPVGGVSFNDKFIAARFLANSVAEVCDSVYWSRLSLQLFLLTGDQSYLDEVERVMYNALPCGVSRDGSWGLRRFRLTHRHIPAHNHFIEGHQCCVENASRGLFQATQSAVFSSGGRIYLGIYEPGHGTLDLPSGNRVALSIHGDYLASGTSEVRVTSDRRERFVLLLRIPHWSRSTTVRVSGDQVEVGEPGSWCRIEREWQPGDIVTIGFDLSPRLEEFDPTVIDESDPRVPWHREHWAKLAFVGDAGEAAPQYAVKPLSVEQGLPQRRAVMVFRGPVALARDVRLGESDVFARVPQSLLVDGAMRFTAGEAPADIDQVYDLHLADGTTIALCDFASAGNSWDERSTFSAWILPS